LLTLALTVAVGAQCVALTSVGLLYQGSSNRRMTEFLLGEVGARTASERSGAHSHSDDADCHALCAGIGLGMVTLGRGGSFVDMSLADLKIEERLMRYIVGGSGVLLPATVAAAVPPPGDEPQGSAMKASAGKKGGSVGVNISVTAPGAIIALALMYLRTGNHTVASLVAPPGPRRCWGCCCCCCCCCHYAP
jgi:anaphase-promoting complex subunit 1